MVPAAVRRRGFSSPIKATARGEARFNVWGGPTVAIKGGADPPLAAVGLTWTKSKAAWDTGHADKKPTTGSYAHLVLRTGPRCG